VTSSGAASGTVSAASGTVSSDVPGTPGVPWWGVVSAVVAPVLLISGWTFAAGLQRGTYNAVADTVSALAEPVVQRNQARSRPVRIQALTVAAGQYP
jgi:hypothetical protein